MYPNGVPVMLTQLRNLLTGTIPQPNPASLPNSTKNGDANTVAFDNLPLGYHLPNNIYDAHDQPSGANPIYRNTPTVAGRWGEETLIPRQLVDPSFYLLAENNGATRPAMFLSFNSPVRAGRSIKYDAPPSPNWLQDTADDTFAGLDFFPAFDTTVPTYPESRDFYDSAGGVQLPSEAARRFVTPIDPSGNGQILQFAPSLPTSPFGSDQLGRVAYSMYYRPPGLPTKVNTPSNTPPPAPAGVGDVANNVLHGYESERFSNFTPLHLTGPHFGEAPFSNQSVTVPTDADVTTSPYTLAPINTLPNPYSSSGAIISKNYAMGSLTTDNAAEMNPYQGSTLDSPFGVQDLEWLYRSHDVDGASLHSRLSQLAPISFLDKVNAQGDGMMRRKMFCGDTYDLTNFVYAYDNPNGTFANNSRFPTLASPTAGASLSNLGVPTPRIAHGDRKINLNFPLPISNDPTESIRRHWISDTYALLK